MEKLQASFDAMLRSISTTFHRYMFNRINWDNRLLGLVGPRGIGKTTLMLQYAKEKLNRNTTLFVNADDLYFSAHHLVDLADEFVKRGGTHLIIDEIHKYKDWARELKLIYDYHADLKVFFTGGVASLFYGSVKNTPMSERISCIKTAIHTVADHMFGNTWIMCRWLDIR